MSSPILVTKPTLPPFEEYVSLIKQIWKNRWLTHSGPLHEQLKEDLKKYLKIKNISLFCNGHNALEAAVHAMNLPKGSEVITTPYSYVSTTHAIVRNGLKPVFCDISYDDYNIDVNKIEELINDNTSAILPVHVYGTPCDVAAVDKIAEKYGLKVIYDAAHAFGVEVDGIPVVNYGDAAMLSFHATKVFNTIEGGAVISKDESITSAADSYRNFGMEGQDDYTDVGTNAKMSEFHAAMGIANLKYADESIAVRKKLCDRYDELLKGVDGIKTLKRPGNVKSNYAYYPIVVEDEYPLSRDELSDKLAENDIFTRKYFYPIIPEFSCYKGKYDFPEKSVAFNVSQRVLSMPLYDTLDLETVDSICELI